MEYLNQWLAAQSHLEKSASNFYDACVTLRARASQVLASDINHAILEDLLHQLQSRVDVIELSEKHMRDSRSVLNSLLNTSKSRVPVNKLPPETLSRIFSLATHSPPHRHDNQHSTLRSISLVCVRWHEVAIKAPFLWSRIDIHPSRPASNAPIMFNRIHLWLNRSCRTPIHIHLSEGFGKGTQEQSDFAWKLVTILRPHASFLRSLKVSGTEGSLSLESLLSLYSIHGASGSLKTLSVSEIRATDRRDIFDWPTNSLVGLVELDLANLGKFSCPSSDVISVMLSNSPTLHTLRLRDLKIRPGPTLGHPDAHLPHLRLLEITDTSGEGLPLLIISLVPGTLELDVRLDFDIDWLDYYFESLLLRSNVTALSLHNISRRHRDRLKSHLCCTPGLRALLLKFTPFPDDPWALGELLVDYNLGSLLPHLHSLCLMHGEISKWFMGDLKRVLSAESLLKLVFVSCRFSLSLGELLESGDGVDENGNDGSDSNDGDNDNDDSSDEDDSDDDADDDTDDDDNSDGNNDDESEEYDKEMPESIKDWLNGAVENIFIFPDRPGQIYEGIDPFVEMLTELD